MPRNKEKELQDIYNKIFEQAVRHMKKYEPQMVAGTLMAIAIRLYKDSSLYCSVITSRARCLFYTCREDG